MVKNKIRLLITCILTLNIGISNANISSTPTFKIYFLKNKKGTTAQINNPLEFLNQKSIDRRVKNNVSIDSLDLPISKIYLDSLVNLGYTIHSKSKWLNAVVIKTDEIQHNSILKLGFISNNAILSREANFNNGQLNRVSKKHDIQAVDFGNLTEQNQMLGIDVANSNGFTGQNIIVGVFDGGFSNANVMSYLNYSFTNNNILFTYDFVKKKTSVYEEDAHGTNVLSLLASNTPGTFVAGAYDAKYILLKTEDIPNESKLEEINWIQAAEVADSAGVDLISTSLGYNTFDNSLLDYTYADMNGATSFISKGASIAYKKGILVIVSAGNEGARTWGKICTPADSPDVIAVGAVDVNNEIGSFSSRGPSSDGRIKPDVCGPGVNVYVASSSGSFRSNGTSFACPMVSALATAFWSEYPYLKASEMKDLIIRSGDKYDSPNNNYGNGVPHYTRMKKILTSILDDTLSTIRTYYNYDTKAWYVDLISESNFEYQIIDIYGNVIDRDYISSNSSIITLTNQAKGLYILQVKTAKGTAVSKAIIY